MKRREEICGPCYLEKKLAVCLRWRELSQAISLQDGQSGAVRVECRSRRQKLVQATCGYIFVVGAGFDRDDIIDRSDFADGSCRLDGRTFTHQCTAAYMMTSSFASLQPLP